MFICVAKNNMKGIATIQDGKLYMVQGVVGTSIENYIKQLIALCYKQDTYITI